MSLQQAQRAGIIILDEPPAGWRKLEHSNTQPCGYEWYSNGLSRWDKDYRHILVRDWR